MQHSSRTKQSGFTMIKTMLLIAVIGLVAALVLSKVAGCPDSARAPVAKQNLGARTHPSSRL